MCKKEILTKMKTKGSLVVIQSYVEEIMKERYREILLEDEIFCLFEKIVDLANDLFEDDKESQKFDLTSIYSVLISLSNRLGLENQSF